MYWAGLWCACLAAFVILGIAGAGRGEPGLDLSLAREVQKLPDPAGDVLRLASLLGGNWRLAALTLIAVTAFLMRGHRAEALLLAATQVPRVLQEGAKIVFDVPRPAAGLLHVREIVDTASYPSGHVVGTTVVFVLLFLLAPRLSRRWWVVWPLRAACGAMIAMVPVSRMWLGVHWPSDCVGGWLFAALWLVPAWQVYRRYRTA